MEVIYRECNESKNVTKLTIQNIKLSTSRVMKSLATAFTIAFNQDIHQKAIDPFILKWFNHRFHIKFIMITK